MEQEHPELQQFVVVVVFMDVLVVVVDIVVDVVSLLLTL